MVQSHFVVKPNLVLRLGWGFDKMYTLYIRSVAEQAAVVWHSSITKGEELDLERVQKVTLRIILKDQYIA